MKKILILILFSGCHSKKIIVPEIDMALYVNVRDFGAAGRPGIDDTHAFSLAMRAADSLHKDLFIPSGTYEADIIVGADNLRIVGEAQPDETLSSGTVIVGKVNGNSRKNISISNIGIDSRGRLGPGEDAALCSGPGADSIPLQQTFRNITIVGDGYLSYKHGMLCQAGSDMTIRNIIVSNFYHGIAIRCSNVSIDSVKAISCGFTSVVIKSAAGYNARTENIFVDHVTITGNPLDAYSRGGLILVQSYDPQCITRHVRIQHVESFNGGVGCVGVEQRNGVTDDVLIENCTAEAQGDSPDRACFESSGGSNITFRNCSANRSAGFGYRCSGNSYNVRVERSYESNSGAGSWTGKFAYLQLNGIEIIK